MHHRVIQAPTLEREWKAATGQQHPYVGLRAPPPPGHYPTKLCASRADENQLGEALDEEKQRMHLGRSCSSHNADARDGPLAGETQDRTGALRWRACCTYKKCRLPCSSLAGRAVGSCRGLFAPVLVPVPVLIIGVPRPRRRRLELLHRGPCFCNRGPPIGRAEISTPNYGYILLSRAEPNAIIRRRRTST